MCAKRVYEGKPHSKKTQWEYEWSFWPKKDPRSSRKVLLLAQDIEGCKEVCRTMWDMPKG